MLGDTVHVFVEIGAEEDIWPYRHLNTDSWVINVYS
jgi:hypothetical protein